MKKILFLFLLNLVVIKNSQPISDINPEVINNILYSPRSQLTIQCLNRLKFNNSEIAKTISLKEKIKIFLNYTTGPSELDKASNHEKVKTYIQQINQMPKDFQKYFVLERLVLGNYLTLYLLTHIIPEITEKNIADYFWYFTSYLNSGTNINFRDFSEKSLLDHAQKLNIPNLISLLLQKEAN